MREAYADVYDVSKKHNVDLRTAAYIIAVKRISDAMNKVEE